MADKKISQLTGASTPLAGTEVLPIVQSSATVKVSVANLTAGRPVSMTTLTASIPSGTDYHQMVADGLLNWGSNGYLVTSFNAATVAGSPGLYIGYNSSTKAGIIGPGAVGGAPNQGMEVWAYDNVSAFKQVGTFSAVTANAGLTLNTGNLIQGTAAKGVNFTANTPSSTGTMTSQLLNWYEEGTWTPAGNGITLSTASGRYVRVGNTVTISAYVVFPVQSDGNSAFVSGLPFTPANADSAIGNATVSQTDYGAVLYGRTATNLARFYLFDASGNILTNANLSGKYVYFGSTYFV